MSQEYNLFDAPNGFGSPRFIGAGLQTGYKRKLARFADPFTPPQSKTECSHTVEPIPGVILCDRWKTEWRHMEVEIYVLVQCPAAADLQTIVEDCIRGAGTAALLAALVAAYATGGAAIPAAKAAFVASLTSCIQQSVANVVVTAWEETHWTDWA